MKVTIVPDDNPQAGDQWALIVSISHTIADGYTYYQARLPSLTSPRLTSPRLALALAPARTLARTLTGVSSLLPSSTLHEHSAPTLTLPCQGKLNPIGYEDEEQGGIPMPMASFGVGGEFGQVVVAVVVVVVVYDC